VHAQIAPFNKQLLSEGFSHLQLVQHVLMALFLILFQVSQGTYQTTKFAEHVTQRLFAE
jgi:hypothetical protein